MDYANVPGDKSISHRSIIIPSISNGVSEIIIFLNQKMFCIHLMRLKQWV